MESRGDLQDTTSFHSMEDIEFKLFLFLCSIFWQQIIIQRGMSVLSEKSLNTSFWRGQIDNKFVQFFFRNFSRNVQLFKRVFSKDNVSNQNMLIYFCCCKIYLKHILIQYICFINVSVFNFRYKVSTITPKCAKE